MTCETCQAGSSPGPFCASCGALQPVPPAATPFDVLGVPRRFSLDEAAIAARHRQLSRKLHPDRFARESPAQRRLALEWTTALNNALRAIGTRQARAETLLRQAGIDLDRESGAEAQKRLPPEFLEAVLDEREALAEARTRGDHASAQALARGIGERLRSAEASLGEVFERVEAGDRDALQTAAGVLARLRYDARFLEEAEAFEREDLET